MADMATLRDIVNGTTADATDVEWNFNTIETHVNTALIRADGAVAMATDLDMGTNQVNNLANGTASTDAVNLGQLTSTVTPLPLGVMGYATRASTQGPITSIADLTSLTVSFTAVTGRLYRATGFATFSGSVDTRTAFTIRDGASTTKASSLFDTPQAGSGQDATNVVTWVGTLTPGATTLKLSAECINSGSIELSAFHSSIVVEDLGLA